MKYHKAGFISGMIFLIGFSLILQSNLYTLPHHALLNQPTQLVGKPQSANATQIPTSPVDLQIALGTDGNILIWNAPYTTGGSIIGYNIYRGLSRNSIQLYQSISSAQLTFLDTLSQTGVLYYYVTATNSLGESLPSNLVSTAELDTPASPVNLQLTSLSKGQVIFSWNLPQLIGGSSLSSVKIYRGTSPSSLVCINTVSVSNIYTDQVNYGNYYYYVTVTNSYGESLPSNEIGVSYLTTPSTPPSLNITQQGNKIFLAWSTPLVNGGTPITGYQIYKNYNNNLMSFLTTVPAFQDSYMDTVTDGGAYTYYVAAQNAMGLSLSISNSTIYQTYPSAPQDLTYTVQHAYWPSDSQVSLTWNPPACDGGNIITSYNIYMHYLNEPATLEGSVSGSQTFFTDNLYLPDTWFYTVTAITSFGEGPPSNEVCYSYPTYSDTVMDLWAQVQGYTIVLEWSSPDTNGTYGNISSYQIFRGTAAGQESYYTTMSGIQTEFVDTNVTADTTYYYSVVPLNSLGEGILGTDDPMRDVAYVDYQTIPTAPLALTAITTDSSGIDTITLNWNLPISNGGSSITNYAIYRGTSSGSEVFLANTQETSYTETISDTQLQYYYVEGDNQLGNSTPSNEVLSAMIQPASSLIVQCKITEINWASQPVYIYYLSWNPPTSDGGASIIGYNIYFGTSRGSETYIRETEQTWVDVNEGSPDYFAYVTAINAAGESLRSNEMNGPVDLSLSLLGNQVILSWSPPISGMGISSYNIYRSTSSGSEILIDSSINTQYSDTIPAGTIYYYMVTALTEQEGNQGQYQEESGYSNEVMIESLPISPDNLYATLANNTIHLQWTSVMPVMSNCNWNYNIYRGVASNAETYLTTIVGNLNDYYDSPSQYGTYYYKVTAVNYAGESVNPNEAICSYETAPDPPLWLNITTESESLLLLSWSAPAGDGNNSILGYNIYRSIDNNSATLLENCSGSQLSYEDTLPSSGSYTYYITALNQIGESAPSGSVTWEYWPNLSVPQSLVGENFGNGFNLSWIAPASNTGSPIVQYLIYRGNNPWSESLLTSVNASAYTLINDPQNYGQTLEQYQFHDTLTQDGMDYYYVIAQNDYGQSMQSNEIAIMFENSSITIEGNTELVSYPYKIGSGTQSDPYLIEDFNENQLNNPIDLTGTTDYVNFLSDNISNCNTGILLTDCSNINIQNINFVNVSIVGIMVQAELNDVQNISINSNFFQNVTVGINISQYCSQISVVANQISQVGIGIESTTAKIDSDRMITDNIISNIMNYGILCNSSGPDQLENNIIKGDLPNSEIGIYASNSSGGISLINNFITNVSVGILLANGSSISSMIYNNTFAYCNQSFLVIENTPMYKVQGNTFLFSNELHPFVFNVFANFSRNYYSNYQTLYPQANLNRSYYTIPYILGTSNQADYQPLVNSLAQTSPYIQLPSNISTGYWNWQLIWVWQWSSEQLASFRQYTLLMNNQTIAQGFYPESLFNITINSAKYTEGDYNFTLILSNGFGTPFESSVFINYILPQQTVTSQTTTSSSSSSSIILSSGIIIGIIGIGCLVIIIIAISIHKNREIASKEEKKESATSLPVPTNVPEYSAGTNEEANQAMSSPTLLATSQPQIRNTFTTQLENISPDIISQMVQSLCSQVVNEINPEFLTPQPDTSHNIISMTEDAITKIIQLPLAQKWPLKRLITECIKTTLRTFISCTFIRQFLIQIGYSESEQNDLIVKIAKDLVTQNPSALIFSDSQILTSIQRILPDADISRYHLHPALTEAAIQAMLNKLNQVYEEPIEIQSPKE